jgi:hypothetical protein
MNDLFPVRFTTRVPPLGAMRKRARRTKLG